MITNMKNWRILSAILLSAGLTLLWNNCSEVGFQTVKNGVNEKVGGFEVIPGTPPSGSSTSNDEGDGGGSYSPPPGSTSSNDEGGSSTSEETTSSNDEGGGDGQDENDHKQCHRNTGRLNACGIETADIVVNVVFIAGAPGKQAPLSSKMGEVSLLELVEQGIEVGASASIKQTNQVRMMFASSGHYILDKDGNKHALIISSQDNSGYHLKLDSQTAITAGANYLLKVKALPVLKRQADGCRLHPNWEDVSLIRIVQ